MLGLGQVEVEAQLDRLEVLVEWMKRYHELPFPSHRTYHFVFDYLRDGKVHLLIFDYLKVSKIVKELVMEQLLNDYLSPLIHVMNEQLQKVFHQYVDQFLVDLHFLLVSLLSHLCLYHFFPLSLFLCLSLLGSWKLVELLLVAVVVAENHSNFCPLLSFFSLCEVN